MIQNMPHFGYDLANKNYTQIIQNMWDKLNELIDFANAPAEQTKLAPSEKELLDTLEKYRIALEKIEEVLEDNQDDCISMIITAKRLANKALRKG